MEEPRIKIGFTFTDHYGNEYSATSNVEVFESLGDTDLDVIGEQLNTFLCQIGYIRKGGLYTDGKSYGRRTLYSPRLST